MTNQSFVGFAAMLDLSRAGLATITAYFKTLSAPEESSRQGFYHACFIGPWWLRISAGPSVALAGLAKWQGKAFVTSTQAVNIVLVGQQRQPMLSMTCATKPSRLDQKPALVMSYGRLAPIPWRWVHDEIRQHDDGEWLGVTIIDLPVLRHLAFPFLLKKTTIENL